MTLSERIQQQSVGAPPAATCPDPHKVGCVEPVGEHICAGRVGYRNDPGLPTWRRLQLERLAAQGFRAEKALS